MTEPYDTTEPVQVKIARLEEKLIAADRALELARAALDQWQRSSNEWRQENIDQRSLYITFDKASAMMSAESALRYALDARVRVLEDSYKLDSGKHSALNTTWVVVAFIISTGIAIAAILLKHP